MPETCPGLTVRPSAIPPRGTAPDLPCPDRISLGPSRPCRLSDPPPGDGAPYLRTFPGVSGLRAPLGPCPAPSFSIGTTHFRLSGSCVILPLCGMPFPIASLLLSLPSFHTLTPSIVGSRAGWGGEGGRRAVRSTATDARPSPYPRGGGAQGVLASDSLLFHGANRLSLLARSPPCPLPPPQPLVSLLPPPPINLRCPSSHPSHPGPPLLPTLLLPRPSGPQNTSDT